MKKWFSHSLISNEDIAGDVRVRGKKFWGLVLKQTGWVGGFPLQHNERNINNINNNKYNNNIQTPSL